LIGYLGLGSNLGDRHANLRAACDELERRGVRLLARSSIYETAPQGELLDQPDFLNAVVKVETEADPEQLLALCKGVESSLGRAGGGPRHGPRPVDVDVLALGQLRLRSEHLELPHREVLSRRFVLEPLLELDPEPELPGLDDPGAALAAVADQRVRRVGPL
jgi:2-amino-4-hydroxy-6-hydroxymethyldihydropteridine diphosphokinase